MRNQLSKAFLGNISTMDPVAFFLLFYQTKLYRKVHAVKDFCTRAHLIFLRCLYFRSLVFMSLVSRFVVNFLLCSLINYPATLQSDPDRLRRKNERTEKWIFFTSLAIRSAEQLTWTCGSVRFNPVVSKIACPMSLPIDRRQYAVVLDMAFWDKNRYSAMQTLACCFYGNCSKDTSLPLSSSK